MENRKKDVSQSVDNALRLLDCFIEKEEWGVSELSRELGLGKASVSRLIGALENKKFLTKDSGTGKYRLGLRLMLFGSLCKDRNEVARAFAPSMRALAEKYQATAHLSCISGSDILILNKISAGPMVYMNSRIGGTLSPYASASGKCLLAFSDDERAELCLKNVRITAFTDTTVKSADELRDRLIKIRLDGYAVDDEETNAGLFCIAVPVLDLNRRPLAAVSLSGAAAQQRERLENIIEDLQKIAAVNI